MRQQRYRDFLIPSFLVSIVVLVFYLFYIHLSTDTLLLFLPNKLFLGYWLRRGIFPLYNPNIFLGIPFAFDVGLGNFHPLNLLFLLPYPWSFALWSAVTTFLFLIGFYLLFYSISKDRKLGWLLTLILFLSGNGLFMRNDNPTIWGVIAHFGIFAWSMQYLKIKSWKGYIPGLLWGVLITLSGHIQYVLYGYIFSFIVAKLFYKVSWKKIGSYFFFLFVLTSWYFILSLPLVLESTRITSNHNYNKLGSILLPQLIQLILPFIFGGIREGAKWFTVPTHTLLISYVATLNFLGLLLKKRVEKWVVITLSLFFVSSLGLINFPFFRGAAQIFILINILILLSIAKHKKDFEDFFQWLSTKVRIIFPLIVLIFFLILFFFNPFFPKLFFYLFRILRKNPSLFYDFPTVRAIGKLFAENLVLVDLFLVFLILIGKFKKLFYFLTFVFIFLEGGIVNYYHTYFISQKYITSFIKNKPFVKSDKFRVQSSADVYPYFGFHAYMGDVLFRPPFSKEQNSLVRDEKSNFEYLRYIFKFDPSSWSEVHNVNTVQGYSTFVPKNVAYYFNNPSKDYKEEYRSILAKNPLFGQVDKHTHINYIESSKITLDDPRWSSFGVRYIISHTSLPNLMLIGERRFGERPIFIYRNKSAQPLYSLSCSGKVSSIKPYYRNPNKLVFKFNKPVNNCTMEILQDPGGFVVTLDRKKEVNVYKSRFSFRFRLKGNKEVEIYYSPFEHLMELFKYYLT